MSADQPLKASVDGDELVVRIGIATLAFSAEHCARIDNCKVVNARELATDVCRAITREREDGSSRLTDMLDESILFAYEDGSTGFAE